MAKNENESTYRVPNQSSGKVTSPQSIVKDSANPRKKTGQDLRSNGNGSKK